MTETTLVLCQKPVLGVLMWLSSLCVANQAFNDTYIDLGVKGEVLSREVDVPMDERYSLLLTFRPAERSEPENHAEPFASYICHLAEKSRNVASASNGDNPDPTLSLEMEISTLEGKPFKHERFSPRCAAGESQSNSIKVGDVDMKRGKYRIVISNQNPVTLNNKGRIQMVFHGAGAGFP